MYTIAHFIFGVPLTMNACRWLEKNNSEPKDHGFVTRYSGSADSISGYLGVDLGSIDEVDPVLIKVNDKEVHGITDKDKSRGTKLFSMQPSMEQILEVEAKIAALPKGLQDVLEQVGVYIVWSTS